MGKGFIIGLVNSEQEYKINGVTYVVSSRFAKPNFREDRTISERLKNFVGSDFADLTADKNSDNLIDGYVCSAAGKEE